MLGIYCCHRYSLVGYVHVHDTLRMYVNVVKMSSIRSKRLTIVHGFRPEADFGQKNRASLVEQNGANFSFIAPSIQEL